MACAPADEVFAEGVAIKKNITTANGIDIRNNISRNDMSHISLTGLIMKFSMHLLYIVERLSAMLENIN
jgi:hypothetical protein